MFFSRSGVPFGTLAPSIGGQGPTLGIAFGLFFFSENVVVLVKRRYQGRNVWDDPIIEKSQDQDQGQGQGQDHLLLQHAALPHYLVLALTLTLTLVLRLFNYRVVPDIPCLITSLDKKRKRL